MSGEALLLVWGWHVPCANLALTATCCTGVVHQSDNAAGKDGVVTLALGALPMLTQLKELDLSGMVAHTRVLSGCRHELKADTVCVGHVTGNKAGSDAITVLATDALPELNQLRVLHLQGTAAQLAPCGDGGHVHHVHHVLMPASTVPLPPPDNDASLASIVTLMSTALPNLRQLENITLSGKQCHNRERAYVAEERL